MPRTANRAACGEMLSRIWRQQPIASNDSAITDRATLAPSTPASDHGAASSMPSPGVCIGDQPFVVGRACAFTGPKTSRVLASHQ